MRALVDRHEQLLGPAQRVGGRRVVYLVRDDRARDGLELVERHVSALRQTCALARGEPFGALAEHELERQIGERLGEPGCQRAVPRPDLATVNGAGRPGSCQRSRRSCASACAKSGTSVGTVANAPPRPIRGPRARTRRPGRTAPPP